MILQFKYLSLQINSNFSYGFKDEERISSQKCSSTIFSFPIMTPELAY